MIKGILFDKDGTLLDFNATWIPPYEKAAAYLQSQYPNRIDAQTLLTVGGFQPTTRTWIKESMLASASNQDILNLWQETVGAVFRDEEIAHVREIFARAAADYVPAVPDIAECLDSLKQRGICLGIATMDDAKAAEVMVDKLNLQGVFDFYCGADSGFGVKPDPGMMQAFLQSSQLQGDQVVMVGDSPRDLQMGRNAGARLSVGVLTGAHSRDMLLPYGDVVLQNIGELGAYFDQLGV